VDGGFKANRVELLLCTLRAEVRVNSESVVVVQLHGIHGPLAEDRGGGRGDAVWVMRGMRVMR
jgi:hypothetical protein